ncbi:MAG: hypothetical protein ABIK15_04745 [Pseudomonadota bacterium]
MSLSDRIKKIEEKLKVQSDLLNHDTSAAERLWSGILQVEMSMGASQTEAEELILERFGLRNKEEFIADQKQQILKYGGK